MAYKVDRLARHGSLKRDGAVDFCPQHRGRLGPFRRMCAACDAGRMEDTVQVAESAPRGLDNRAQSIEITNIGLKVERPFRGKRLKPAFLYLRHRRPADQDDLRLVRICQMEGD